MTHPLKQPDRPKWLPFVDLRGVTRDSNAVMTHVEVLTEQGYFLWLRFGSLASIGDRRSSISAKYVTATDSEHSPAYAFTFDVVGFRLEGVYHGNILFIANIAGSDDDAYTLKVPRESILSEKDLVSDGEDCPGKDGSNWCGDPPHRIVAFTPKADKELWGRLRGRTIKITVIPNPQKIDEYGMLPPVGEE